MKDLPKPAVNQPNPVNDIAEDFPPYIPKDQEGEQDEYFRNLDRVENWEDEK